MPGTIFKKKKELDFKKKKVILCLFHLDSSVSMKKKCLILAPMVRVCTLPFRLISLKYGAGIWFFYSDYVYGPEIIDRKVIGCERVENSQLGTIDFVKNGKVFFRTSPMEKSRLVFQLGTSSPDLALQAAKIVQGDVCRVDVNCGCPKHFSIQGGMGAALLSNPETLCSILSTLVQNLSIPVSAKIRVFPDAEKTLELVGQIVSTGISALAVHCRTKEDRPETPGDWEIWRKIAAKYGDQIPIIANGDVFDRKDVQNALEIQNIDGLMIARGARKNPSIFQSIPIDANQVALEYLELAVKYASSSAGVKYILSGMVTDSEILQKLFLCKNFDEILKLFAMDHLSSKLKLIRETVRDECM